MILELSGPQWRALRFRIEMELLTIHDDSDRASALNSIMKHILGAGLDRLESANRLIQVEANFDRSKPVKAPSWAFRPAMGRPNLESLR